MTDYLKPEEIRKVTENAIVPAAQQNPLANIDTDPHQMRARAEAVAGAVRQIVLACVQHIQGRRYVKVEGWQAIANTYGCVASGGPVEKVEGGWLSIGTVKHLGTDRVISIGEGFVGEDEPMWMKRTLHARRAMAQTRGISRACRAAFAFIIPMIDANLQTTPAEEMPHDEEEERPRARAPARARTPPEEAELIGGERVDAETGELLATAPPTSDELGGWEAKVRGASGQADALSIVNAAPTHVRKRLIQAYRESWVK